MASLLKNNSTNFSKASVVDYKGGLFGCAREIEKKDCASAPKFLSSFLGAIQRIISPTVRLIPVTQRTTEN